MKKEIIKTKQFFDNYLSQFHLAFQVATKMSLLLMLLAASAYCIGFAVGTITCLVDKL